MSIPDIKKIQVAFYKTPAGNEPVRDWLKELPAEEKKTIGEDIKAVEMAWPIGISLVKKLDADLWEVRTILPNKLSRLERFHGITALHNQEEPEDT